MIKNIPSVRGPTLRQGYYVPMLNGIDLPITTFDMNRAYELAEQAAKEADLKEQQKELGLFND